MTLVSLGIKRIDRISTSLVRVNCDWFPNRNAEFVSKIFKISSN